MSGKLTITIGLPGSGKSYYAQQQLDAVIVERDMIRKELTGDARNHSAEGRVTGISRARVVAALDEGKHVIVSDTNLAAKTRRQWKTLAESLDAVYDEVSFLHVAPEVCIERDARREHPVGADVIRSMYQRYLA